MCIRDRFSLQRLFVTIAYPVAGLLIDYLSVKLAFLLDVLGDGVAITLFTLLSRGFPTLSLLVLPVCGFFGEAITNVAYEVYTSRHGKGLLATTYGALKVLPRPFGIVGPLVWGILWGVDPWLALLTASLMTFVGLPLTLMLKECR